MTMNLFFCFCHAGCARSSKVYVAIELLAAALIHAYPIRSVANRIH
jgi:hypothetical protein